MGKLSNQSLRPEGMGTPDVAEITRDCEVKVTAGRGGYAGQHDLAVPLDSDAIPLAAVVERRANLATRAEGLVQLPIILVAGECEVERWIGPGSAGEN
jgi:hypothetical protein